MDKTGQNAMSKIPLCLTWGRIIVVPVLVLFYYWEIPYHLAIATSMFALAAITDWLDGYLARKWQVQSKFGEFLDPIADKILVTVALIIIAVAYQKLWLTLCVCILISRELYVTSLRQLMDSINQSILKVSIFGKIKTTTQLVGITMLLYQSNDVLNIPWIDIGSLLIIVSTFFSIHSMCSYSLTALRQLRK